MSSDGRILVVCAVAAELAALEPRDTVDVLAVGVGPVEAASGTARALAGTRYAALVHAGIAGGFRGRITIGEPAIVAIEHYVELGLEDGSTFPLPGGVELARRAESDAGLLLRVREKELGILIGSGVTSATVTSTHARAIALASRFDVDVESMEGFAVLRAATAAGIPAIEARGISNFVGDRADNGWDFRAGARAAVATTQTLLDVLLTQ